MSGEVAADAMTPVCAALLCAGAGLWRAGGRDNSLRRARLLLAGGEGAGSGPAVRRRGVGQWPRTGRRWAYGERAAGRCWTWTATRSARLGHALWCLPVGAVLGLLGQSLLPVALGVLAVPVAHRRLTGRAAQRERDRRRDDVIAFCAAVAAELRAGCQPGQALVLAGAEGRAGPPGWGSAGDAVLAAARFGGDVPGALREAARLPGAEGLTGVAACWQVAVQGGVGLAAGIERVTAGLRAQREQQAELQAQLAGARTTALMLALLPVFGLLMGSALGADPLHVLLHTPAGWACLAVGGLLEWAGVLWTGRIVRTAEGRAER
ncbi:type II secretion system F family protein [Streptomyces ochraceiscleroticus]|uniref:Type II secretion system F family protein n=1 Tax=Streptomyces ochraceiscleroticus TaxID=47761 RepID=A0ABW1MLU5_9ACTN|nr:type II secretion system F family protein [Streptomyces ochraceiscleroticus]